MTIRNHSEEIIRHNSNVVYRLAYAQMRNKTDADDLYQEVFLRYINKKPQFESDEHMKAWFIRVTVNCAKKHFTSSWFKKHVISDSLPEEIIDEKTDLDIDLDGLPEKYRHVIHLFYYEDMSVDQISEVLGKKASTIRTQLTRGRRLLRDILEEVSDA